MMPSCPVPLDCNDVYGRLVIDGWSLHTGAWCAYDLSDLFRSPAFKGENVPVDGEPGTSARSLLPDETTYSVPMMFSGAVDRTGTPHTDTDGGLLANRQAAVARWVDPIRNGTATLAASLYLPTPAGGEVEWSAAVQPLGFEDWQLLPVGYAEATLAVRVTAGGFEQVY